MLETLEQIPWGQIPHAYGPASDVPGLIRDLASSSAEIRKQARWELYGTIFHQGTRYQATVYAIPFLYELLTSDATPDRHEIIYLLVNLAIGCKDSYLPIGFDASAFRAEVASASQTLSAEDRAAYDEYGAGPWVDLACYDGVRRGMPTLLALLVADDLLVKRAALYALAWLPEDRAESLPEIYRLLERESDPLLITTGLLTAGLLQTAAPLSGGRGIRALLAHRSLPVRTAAAIALAPHGGADEALVALSEALSRAEELDRESAGIYIGEAGLTEYVCLVLAHYGAPYREQVVPLLCQLLKGRSGLQSYRVTQALLQLAFPAGAVEPHGLSARGALSEHQRQALRAIATDGGWSVQGALFANYAELMRAYGLPDTQERLQRSIT